MKQRLLLTLLLIATCLFILDHAEAYAHKPNSNSKDMALYTTTWRAYSNSLRLHLNNNSIPVMEQDTEKPLSGIVGFWAFRARGTPV